MMEIAEIRMRAVEAALRYGSQDWLSMAQSIVKFVQEEPARRKTYDDISALYGGNELLQFFAENQYDLTLVRSRSRRADVVAMRDAAIVHVWSRLPSISLPAMGRLFNRDHTSILYSLQKNGVTERHNKPFCLTDVKSPAARKSRGVQADVCAA